MGGPDRTALDLVTLAELVLVLDRPACSLERTIGTLAQAGQAAALVMSRRRAGCGAPTAPRRASAPE